MMADVPPMDETRLEEIARKHGMVLVLLYGSAVSGPTHARSDVDVAVLLDRATVPFREWGEVAADLQALWPGRKVDLAFLNRADPLFLRKITERCRLLYGSPRRFAELKMYAFKRYQDHRRYLGLEREYVARTLRALAAS